MNCLIYVMLLLFHEVSADYECLCNYNTQLDVYSEAETDAPTIGILYEFDCIPTIPLKPNAGWVAVAFEHKVGYVQQNNQVQVQMCPGNPPEADRVTSITSTTSLPRTTHSSSPNPPTSSTTPQTKTSARLTGATKLSATTTKIPSSRSNRSSTTSSFLQSTSTTVPVTVPTRFSTSTPTMWTTRGRITLKPASTAKPVITGNINLCPSILHRYALEDGGALTQYGHFCYELVPIRATWSKALGDCRAKGGTLFTIPDQGFQDFIYNWIKSYGFAHALWTGLTDKLQEEHFEWVSGDPVRYTNWYHDRFGNLASHHVEDCVLLVPYAPYNGKWDDAHCGETNIFGTDVGQTSPFICQYSIYNNHGQPGGLVG